MMMTRSAQPSIPPLFVWHEQTEIERLQAERAILGARIEKLRPHCHKRVELTARMRAITERQLQLQIEMEKKAC
ncbi:hypothetical protein [Nitratireductor soli]|uniref:hypothetical protein n=1 Tax=Nitratireductor soli TaxID=1670619 RepID=UPI00065DFCDD|nr:hypothetical protein [Nitratireductor soli]